MITLSQPSKMDKGYVAEAQKPAEAVETAGSLAMLFESGLMTMGQYDEYISSNPFAVDYSMYATSEGGDSIAMGGFLSDFASAVSSLGGFTGSGFSGGFSAGGCGASCGGGGGFSSVC